MQNEKEAGNDRLQKEETNDTLQKEVVVEEVGLDPEKLGPT